MRLNQHQIDIVFAAAGTVIIIGYVLLFQRPVNRRLKALRSEIRTISVSDLSAEALKSKLNLLNEEKARLSQEIDALRVRYFQADPLWDLMQSLSRMAEEAGLTVILVHPQTKSETDQYQQGALLVRLSGDFLSFYRFLAMFEKSVPGIRTSSLKIEARPAAPQPAEALAMEAQQAEGCPGEMRAGEAQPGDSQYLEEVQFDLITMPPS
ncbi:MAG: type 4a pilus biogenesis protein PilO [bacterium]